MNGKSPTRSGKHSGDAKSGSNSRERGGKTAGVGGSGPSGGAGSGGGGMSKAPLSGKSRSVGR